MDRTARIIVGVDHSEESLNALGFAVEEAALRRVELEVMWAWSDHTPRSHAFGGAGDGVDVQLSAQRQLEGLVESRVPEDLDVTIRAVVDKPDTALVDSAERAELLVVGTRGRGGLLGLRLGSVSVKVAGRAPCPVVVVRPTADGPEVNTEPRIVVGVDGSGSARNALRWALTEASVRNLPIVVVNGWMEPTVAATFPGMASPIDAIGRAASELIEAELEMTAQDAAGVTVRVQAVCASGASALVDESRGASLVVVGSKGQGGLSRVLLGSVAQQVMRHAECPVAVIPQS